MNPMSDLKSKQEEMLGPVDSYRAKLILNVEREPEVILSVRIAENLRDEMRAFCKEHDISQHKFVTEAVKEVLSRIKHELEEAL